MCMLEAISTMIRPENEEFFKEYIPGSLWEKRMENGWFFYGGMVDETACGAMVAELQGVTLVIHSIYVAPGYRGLGVATELLFTLEDMAHLYYIPSIRVELLEDPEGEAGLQKLLQIFTTNIKETGNVQYEFDGTQVNWEKLHLRKQISNCCVTLEDCDEALRQQVNARMEEASRCYVPLPFRAQNYDAKHSMIYRDHSGIQGILLMHRTEDGIYILDYMGNFGDHPEVFLGLLNGVVATFRGKEQQCRFHVACVNDKVAALMNKLIRIPPRRELTARIAVS